MQKWKKAMSALLMTGMLTTACAGMALADTTSGSAQERPAGQRGGGMFMEEDWLTEQIAGLSSEQQAEILALQAELKALQPEKERREMPTLSTEQQAVMEEYQSQIKAKEEAITAIFTEAGVTLTAPERGQGPQDKAEQTKADKTLPERPEGVDNEPPDGERPMGGKGGMSGDRPMGGKGGFGGSLISEEDLAQLDSDAQAQVQTLQQEIKALQESMHTALGMEQPERTERTEAEKTAGEEERAAQQELRQALQEALTAAGIELPQPPAGGTAE